MTMTNLSQTPVNQRGVGMIEVLVTVIIMAVGLMGLASLQMHNLKSVNGTEQRTLATLMAYDLAERIRSNKGAGLAAYRAEGAIGAVACSDCSLAQIAQDDLHNWQAELTASGLNEAVGRVTFDAAGHLEIKISWDQADKYAATSNADGVDTKSFTLKMKY